MSGYTDSRTMSCIQWVAFICLSVLFLSLLLSVWDIKHKPNQPKRGINIMLGGQKNTYHPWPALEKEKALYRAHGYDISWMKNTVLLKAKVFFGQYAALLELMALRFFGLSKFVPLIVGTSFLAISEGRARAGKKRNTHGNISATRYKLAVAASHFAVVIPILFITLPFGTELPVIGGLPLTIGPFWTTSPMMWGVFLSTLNGAIVFHIFSNLSTDV